LDSESLFKYINEEYREKLVRGEMVSGIPVFEISPRNWLSVCESLRDDDETQLHSISNYSAVDYRESKGGYELVVTVFSHILNHRITLKTLLPAEGEQCPEIETLSVVWPSADWFEREAAELFGIVFTGHPDPRHLMLDDDWDEGYPLRKGWTGTDFIVRPDK
jgi:NADH:ubiquinone oxidoreductase subunit C